MTNISAFLFDCDGTVFFKVEKAHEYAAIDTLRQALKEQDLYFNKDSATEIWTAGLGKGIYSFFDSYIKYHEDKHEDGISNKLSAGDLDSKYEGSFIALVSRVNNNEATEEERNFFALRKGMAETVKMAEKLGIPFAVISNATQNILEQTMSTAPEIKKSAVLIAGADTVINAGYEIKPQPGSYQYAGDILGIDLGNAVGYEDTLFGARSLDDAGIGHIIYCDNNITNNGIADNKKTLSINFNGTSREINIEYLVGTETNIAKDIPIIARCEQITSNARQFEGPLMKGTFETIKSATQPNTNFVFKTA